MRFLSWLLLGALVLMWGTSFFLIKRGLAVYSPLQLAALRITLAALILLPVGWPALRTVPRARWGWLFVAGLMGNLLPAVLFSWAETRLASGLAGILNTLTGLFTLLAGAAFFGQHLTALRVVGVLVGMGGTALLLASGPGGLGLNAANGTAAYGLLIVLATAMYGLNLNLIRYKLTGIAAAPMAALALLAVGVPAFAVVLGTGVVPLTLRAAGGWPAFGAVAALAAGSTALGLVLYNKLIQERGTLFAASTVYLMPVVSLLWGVLDGERIYAGHYAGLGVILMGVTLVNRAK